MLELIHATMIETDKRRQFYLHVLPAMLQRQERESVASLREQVDTVIEAFIISGLVHAEVRHEPMANLIEPLVRQQIVRGVNVPLNCARLIEVLIHQRRETEAQDLIAAFKADFGADFMLPGVYIYRPLHPTVDDAVAAMRERASALN
jgi:molybdopterin-guanine dinucleotide biosynthesis protein A